MPPVWGTVVRQAVIENSVTNQGLYDQTDTLPLKYCSLEEVVPEVAAFIKSCTDLVTMLFEKRSLYRNIAGPSHHERGMPGGAKGA